MIRVFILFLFLVFSSYRNVNGQEILYVFSDEVEKVLETHITSISHKVNQKFYLTLSKENEFSITVSSYSDGEKGIPVKWINCTTRYALINKKKYPVLLDSDYVFGAPDLGAIGTFGKREGQVKRVLIINEGFVVRFNKNGKILPN